MMSSTESDNLKYLSELDNPTVSSSLTMCITGPVRQANGCDNHHTRNEAYDVAAQLTGSICHFTPELSELATSSLLRVYFTSKLFCR